MEPYADHGPAKCDAEFDISSVKGKTAVITGGASGMGEAYVKNLAKAGAFVIFGDINEQEGKRVESEAGQNVKFVSCDVTKWADQLAMFKEALAHSPSRRVDIVIANAGIGTGDDIFSTDLELEDPKEPQMQVMKVNGLGVLYTTQLALHYFRRQFKADPEASPDQLLILQGSLAGYVDLPGSIQYDFAKYGMRGMMKSLRRTETAHNIRVNYIAPTFIKTNIISKELDQVLSGASVEYATVDDAARAVMKLCSDPSINGRTFGILPRSWAESGYMDLDVDDRRDSGYLKYITEVVVGLGQRH